jgi:TetR/AcrR family transcriptional regulator, transcriptional repressor of bet genes
MVTGNHAIAWVKEWGMLSVVPKQVDRHQRRLEIADAVWRVVAEQGFEGASLRHVAAEAGVSMGLVQHYFATKREMLRFAMDAVQQSTGERFATELAGLPDPPPPRAAVRAFLVQLIPTSEQRRREGAALFAHMVGGVHDDAIGEQLRSGIAQLTRFIATHVAAAGIEPDADAAASTLLALADGLATHVLSGYLDAERAIRLLDAHLDRVFRP